MPTTVLKTNWLSKNARRVDGVKYLSDMPWMNNVVPVPAATCLTGADYGDKCIFVVNVPVSVNTWILR